MFRSRVLPRVGKSLGLGLRTTVNARRCLHRVPALPHDYSQGVPNLMSRSGFQIAWTENMSMLLEKLNALTVGSFIAAKLWLMRAGGPRLHLARSSTCGRGVSRPARVANISLSV